MKLERADEFILSYVLLVNFWFLGKNLFQNVVVFSAVAQISELKLLVY